VSRCRRPAEASRERRAIVERALEHLALVYQAHRRDVKRVVI
jgi:hypothetical protein